MFRFLQIAKFSRSMSALSSFTLKTPKGTRDYNERECALRNEILGVIVSTFKLYGAATIETPTFELREVLTGKYGEDSKLIYNLEDQGGELCSLRYDLTVPLARYVAQNKISKLKRYQIAKVYRRDQPSVSQGRLREFLQCDFDIIGTYDAMLPEAECLSCITDIITKLKINNFQVRVNHRLILDGIFRICGVPEEKVRNISSSIDKLDKKPWCEVKQEIKEKGVSEDIAERIYTYLSIKGDLPEICKKLKELDLMNDERARKGVSEMEILSEYIDAYSVSERIVFDLSLARGLDYYTGLIYEAGLCDDSSLGSIAGGGRYDELVGMFSGGLKSVDCVGFSVGFERIFSYLSKLDYQPSFTKVLVGSVGKLNVKEVVSLCTEIRQRGISAEYTLKTNPRLQSMFDYSDKQGIPYLVLLGKKEIESNLVTIKTSKIKLKDGGNEAKIERSKFIQFLEEELRSL